MNEQELNSLVKQVMEKMNTTTLKSTGKTVPVAISGRHVHLSQHDADILFGTGYQFKKMKDLSQPGQFAAEEKLVMVGPRGVIEGVRILGPVRPDTQCEISQTDAVKIGVKPPVRDSGDLAGSPGIVLVGPKGTVKIEKGVILAKRHIHFHDSDAGKFGVKDKQIVSVKTGGERSVTFGEVLCRVSPKYALEMHMDTDEANAAGVCSGDNLELIV